MSTSVGLTPRALQATRESKYIEFKAALDVTSAGDWCEVIKDMVAIANSGGGEIVIGLDNKGMPTGFDPQPVLQLDPADVANRLNHYTAIDFTDFDIFAGEKNGMAVAVVSIRASEYPIVFCKPGTYAIAGGKQKSAFSQGTIYFRHGAKSEPGSTDDLRKFVDRKLAVIRKEWISAVRKVVTSPPGSQVAIEPRDVSLSVKPAATEIRIVTDPNAPAFRHVSPDETHPYRQKDLIAEVRRFLLEGQHFSSHDAVAIRRVYDIEANPAFFHRPKFASPQYSPEYVSWLRERIDNDAVFLEDVRRRFSGKIA